MVADSGRLSRHRRGGFPRRWQGGAEGEKGKPRPLAAIGFFAPTRKNGPASSVDGIGIALTGRGCPVPPQGRGGGPASELLRRRICRGSGCGVVFWICRHCDRGHRYCGERCRQKKRRQQRAGRQPAAPAKPGGAARSPRPATGLPGKAPPAARDGSYFRPPPPIRQHPGNMDKNAKKAALWGGISASAAIEAAPSRHSGRLHRVWTHAAVIGPEREKRCLGKRRRLRQGEG